MGPPAGGGAELQFASAPFHAPELAGLNLVFQILCGLEQRGFERVVKGLGVEVRAGNLQQDSHVKGRRDFSPVFHDHFGGGYGDQSFQMLELLLHESIPAGMGVQPEKLNFSFHICLRTAMLSAGAPALGGARFFGQRFADLPGAQTVQPHRVGESFARFPIPPRRLCVSFLSPVSFPQ